MNSDSHGSGSRESAVPGGDTTEFSKSDGTAKKDSQTQVDRMLKMAGQRGGDRGQGTGTGDRDRGQGTGRGGEGLLGGEFGVVGVFEKR